MKSSLLLFPDVVWRETISDSDDGDGNDDVAATVGGGHRRLLGHVEPLY